MDPHARSFVGGPERIPELHSLATLQGQQQTHPGMRTESSSLADSQVDDLKPGGGAAAQGLELLWAPGPVGLIGNATRIVGNLVGKKQCIALVWYLRCGHAPHCHNMLDPIPIEARCSC